MSEHRSESGFSLIELMVVVAIIGILSSIITRSYRLFIIKSRQVEVKLMTGHFHGLLQAKLLEGGTGRDFYANLTSSDVSTTTSCNLPNTLGFKSMNCKAMRYSYVFQADPAETFEATEIVDHGTRRVYTGCNAILDHWHFYFKETGISTLEHNQDPTSACI